MWTDASQHAEIWLNHLIQNPLPTLVLGCGVGILLFHKQIQRMLNASVARSNRFDRRAEKDGDFVHREYGNLRQDFERAQERGDRFSERFMQLVEQNHDVIRQNNAVMTQLNMNMDAKFNPVIRALEGIVQKLDDMNGHIENLQQHTSGMAAQLQRKAKKQ